MSLNVGQGWIPEQDVVEVTQGGNDSNDGLTAEKPKLTIGSAIAQAQAQSKSSVRVSDGLYDEQLVMATGVDINGPGAAIFSQSSGGVVLDAASVSTTTLGFLGGQASNQIIYQINGKQRSQFVSSTLVVGTFIPGPLPTGLIGINIIGANDDTPITIVNGEFRSDSSTLISFTGTVETPPTITLGKFTNFGDNNKLITYNPSSSNQQCTLNVSWTDDATAAPAGTDLIEVVTGVLNVIADGGLNVAGSQVATVRNTGKLDIAGPAIAGDVTVDQGGFYQTSALSLHAGSLDVQGEANIFINSITGDFTLGPNGTLRGIIGSVGGTVTIDPAADDAGRVNAIVNGEPFGSYKYPSFLASFSAPFNLNDGAFPSTGMVRCDTDKGVVLNYDAVVEAITWSEDFSNVGRFDIYSDGVKIGEATKPASDTGVAEVVLTVPGSFVPAMSTISPQWVGTGGGNANNRRMRRPAIFIIGKRRVS